MADERTPLAAFLATLQTQATADPAAVYTRLPALRAALGLADESDDVADDIELAAEETVAAVKDLNISLLRLVPHLIDAEGSDEPEDHLLRIEAKLAGAKARLYITQVRERYGLDDPDDDPEAA